jgi:RNA polymerase sigma factor (sigma-70 family)
MLNVSPATRGQLPLKAILTLIAACANAPQSSRAKGKPGGVETGWNLCSAASAGQGGIKPHRVSGTLELLWKLWRHECHAPRRILIEEQICRLCKPLVAATARSIRLGNSGCDMDDLIQEGFIALLSCLRRYQPDNGTDFAAFVPKSIRGAMLDAAARYRRYTPCTPSATIEQIHQHAATAAEDPWIIDLEVAHMLKSLTTLQRDIVTLCIIGDQTTRQAGRHLGIHASTVSRQLRMALDALRRHATI